MKLCPEFHLPRPQLARAIAQSCAAHSHPQLQDGLCLVGPKGTGKSEFVRLDFAPALADLGSVPVCVDLTPGSASKPLEALEAGVAEALSATRTVVVIVDGADAALGTPEGQQALNALRSASQHVRPDRFQPAVVTVLVGSSTRKLMDLVCGRSAVFPGAALQKLPPMDEAFSCEVTRRINAVRAPLAHLAPEAVDTAFSTLQKCPDALFAVLSDELLSADLESRAPDLPQAAHNAVAKRLATLSHRLSELPRTQRVLFDMVAESGGAFSPYTEKSSAELACRLGGEVSKTTIQSAIRALRTKGFVWQASDKHYIIDDDDVLDLRLHHPPLMRRASSHKRVRRKLPVGDRRARQNHINHDSGPITKHLQALIRRKCHRLSCKG